ncbi:hypothetical protein EVAR_50657_1 [Eumeta japonica]|uniref:Uncharacterized protein n=1 Tax=Eumeta variegata TaxID=151549 RepID=A0A4C1XKM5_EUMVA|nr:hypothetical protein EVAR_50657_1 [Eumeta japonica]
MMQRFVGYDSNIGLTVRIPKPKDSAQWAFPFEELPNKVKRSRGVGINMEELSDKEDMPNEDCSDVEPDIMRTLHKTKIANQNLKLEGDNDSPLQPKSTAFSVAIIVWFFRR